MVQIIYYRILYCHTLATKSTFRQLNFFFFSPMNNKLKIFIFLHSSSIVFSNYSQNNKHRQKFPVSECVPVPTVNINASVSSTVYINVVVSGVCILFKAAIIYNVTYGGGAGGGRGGGGWGVGGCLEQLHSFARNLGARHFPQE